MSRQRSLGERLLWGFGSIIATIAVMLVVVQRAQERSAAAQRELSEYIVPRAQLAWQIERAVLLVGVQLRTHLLEPNVETLRRLRDHVDSTRRTMGVLRAMPKTPQGQQLFARFDPLVLHYLDVADSLATARPSFDAAVERRLVEARGAALGPVQAYAVLQRLRQDSVLQRMGASRRDVMRSVLFALLACLGGATVAGALTIRSVQASVRRLLATAQRLERGEWHTVAAPVSGPSRAASRDEFARIDEAFSVAAGAVAHRERELRARSTVAGAMVASLDTDTLSASALRAVVDHLGAEVGVVHLAEQGQLRPAATSAIAASAIATTDALREEDGVPGRALRERRTVVLDDLPADTAWQVRVGFDRAPVRSVVSVPIATSDEAFGALTVGALRPLHADAVAFLEATALQLSLGLRHAKRHQEVQLLLTEVSSQRARIQDQYERLQAQNEELQGQYEEIQAQAEEIQAQNEELHAQTEEIQAQNIELHGHAEQLASADDQKNRFLGLLAHELRNPLAAITNSVHVLQLAGEDPDRRQRSLGVIARQTRQLTRLIDDLLDVTRIVQGKLTLERRSCELGQLLRESVTDHQERLDLRGVSCEVQCPERPVLLNADCERLRQVFGNLLDNAIKFTDRGGRVSLRCEVDGADAVVRVEDTGIGIDPALLSGLFTPFVQANASGHHPNGGLGLGLALVKAYVEMHDGTVAVSSDGPGHGFRVTVHLPVARTSQPEADGAEFVTVALRPADGDVVPRPRLN